MPYTCIHDGEWLFSQDNSSHALKDAKVECQGCGSRRFLALNEQGAVILEKCKIFTDDHPVFVEESQAREHAMFLEANGYQSVRVIKYEVM